MNKNSISIINVLKYTFILGFLVLIIFLVMFQSNIGTNPVRIDENIMTNYSHNLVLGGVSLKAEYADTKQTQAQGLSGRMGMKEEEAMLFIFDNPARYKFWMKDMNFPIDMIWFNKDKVVTYIEHDATPESYPELFGPTEDSLYVLEVVSGFADKHNIKIGDAISF